MASRAGLHPIGLAKVSRGQRKSAKGCFQTLSFPFIFHLPFESARRFPLRVGAKVHGRFRQAAQCFGLRPYIASTGRPWNWLQRPLLP